MPVKDLEEFETSKVEARRAFLKNCAKYAVGMPPAISLLVSAQGAFGADTNNPNCSRLCNEPPDPDPTACKCDPETEPLSLDTQLFQSEPIDPEITQ